MPIGIGAILGAAKVFSKVTGVGDGKPGSIFRKQRSQPQPEPMAAAAAAQPEPMPQLYPAGQAPPQFYQPGGGGVPLGSAVPVGGGNPNIRSAGFGTAFGSAIDAVQGFAGVDRQAQGEIFGGDGQDGNPPELDFSDANPFDGRTKDDEALRFLMLFGKNFEIPAGVAPSSLVKAPILYTSRNGGTKYGAMNGFRIVQRTVRGRVVKAQVWKPIADRIQPRRRKPLLTAADARILTKAGRVEKKIKRVTKKVGLHVYDEARPEHEAHHHTTHHHPGHPTHTHHHHKE